MSENDNPFDKDWTNPVDEVVAKREERTKELEFLAGEFERIQEVTEADEVDFQPHDIHFNGDVITVVYRWEDNDE